MSLTRVDTLSLIVANIISGMSVIHSVKVRYKRKKKIKCIDKKEKYLPRFDYSHDDPECNLPIFNLALPHEEPNIEIKLKQRFKVYCPNCKAYFYTTIKKHLGEGYGCPTCDRKYEYSGSNKIGYGSRYRAAHNSWYRLKAISLHKGYYLYHKCWYVDSYVKICITCPRTWRILANAV